MYLSHFLTSMYIIIYQGHKIWTTYLIAIPALLMLVNLILFWIWLTFVWWRAQGYMLQNKWMLIITPEFESVSWWFYTDDFENVFAFEEMYWSISKCIFKMFSKLI